jgi:hypothetical protein
MKTFLSTLALALALSFTATPAAALGNLAKCRVYNAKIKMNYAKCLELDNLLVEKGKAAKGICESKRTTSLEKATAKFVTKLHVDAADCGIESDTADAQRDVQLLASANSLSACEAANGTWDGSVCTPAAVADRDCFRAGVCGTEAYNHGNYVGVNIVSSGCSDTEDRISSFQKGVSGGCLACVPSWPMQMCE